MAQSVKAQELSMEEILASIRRIIADDDTDPTVVAENASESPQPESLRASSRILSPAYVSARASSMPTEARAKPVPPSAPLTPSVIKNTREKIGAMLAEIDAQAADAEVHNPTLSPNKDIFKLTKQAAIPKETPTPQQLGPPSTSPLMSAATIASVESAFNKLTNAVLDNNAAVQEDLVKEMLRPMLKSWLDDNLPNIVERIVRAEIERVSRGR